MKTHHVMLFTCYTTFLVGMVAGAALARSPILWLVLIILTAIAVALMGAINPHLFLRFLRGRKR